MVFAVGDTDNDGDLDAFIGLVVAPDEPWTNLLLQNDGRGFFTDISAESGIPRDDWGPHIALADYDENGFIDLLISSFGLSRNLTALYRNNGIAHHYLRVELVGVESNRSGIGARLIATAGGQRQMREMLSGLGHEQFEKIAHFGLGEHARVDSLEVRWPSGQVDVLRDIPADQKIRVIEGRGDYVAVEANRWVSLIDSVVAGAPFDANIAVRPALFDPDAEIGPVVADVSAFGGFASAALDARADGSYALQGTLRAPARNGFYPLSVMIDQRSSVGPHWARLSRRVAVLPAGDAAIGINFQGSVRLADIRLVAAEPPLRATAVEERRTDGQPASFALAQNYPIPSIAAR